MTLRFSLYNIIWCKKQYQIVIIFTIKIEYVASNNKIGKSIFEIEYITLNNKVRK